MLTSLLTAATVAGSLARGTVKPLQGEGQLSDAISRATSKSLIEYTQSTRVEPIVLLDQTAVQLPYIEDVLKVVNSIFAAYYLQAVALSVNVGRVDTVRLLGRLNPQRSVTNAAAALIGDVYSTNSHQFMLPEIPSDVKFSAESDNADYNMVASLESYTQKLQNVGGHINSQFNKASTYVTDAGHALDMIADGKKRDSQGNIQTQRTVTGRDKNGNRIYEYVPIPINKNNDNQRHLDSVEHGSGITGDAVGKVHEIANLCVGKMLDVHVNSGKSSAVIPVQLRLIVSAISPKVLANIFRSAAKNLTFTERYHSWRSGMISISDFVLCKDILREHRETLQGDRSGTYASMSGRRASAQAAGVIRRDPSVGAASNIAVFTTQSQVQIETEAGGKLNNFKLREQIFSRTGLMLMVVIDQKWEQVTIYHQSIELPTTFNLAALKTANRGNGPDVTEMLKTLMKGKAPVI